MKRCFSEVAVDMGFGPDVNLIWSKGSVAVYFLAIARWAKKPLRAHGGGKLLIPCFVKSICFCPWFEVEQ
jgi:hypothetical protein